MILSVLTIKPKRLKLKSPNWRSDSPSGYLAHQRIVGQKVKKSRRDSRAAPSLGVVTPLNETAPHGRHRRELCTLSSAQNLVIIISLLLRRTVYKTLSDVSHCNRTEEVVVYIDSPSVHFTPLTADKYESTQFYSAVVDNQNLACRRTRKHFATIIIIKHI